MGRYDRSDYDQDAILSALQNIKQSLADNVAGQMGVFGSGLYRIFAIPGSYTWTVPTDITSIRVRVVGAGGGIGTAINGGTSSFGALVSATGGKSNAFTTTGCDGGVGIGGDFQAKGGAGGNGLGSYMVGPGGGAAGSQLGDGGDGGSPYNDGSTTYPGGGGAVGGNPGGSKGGGGASPYGSGDLTALGTGGPSLVDTFATTSAVTGPVNPSELPMRFPFDCFPGGGGAASTTVGGDGGPGAGGGGARQAQGGKGGHGGGGGGGSGSTGGIGGLGAGDGNYTYQGAAGGGGYAHGTFAVSPGTQYAVTVGAPPVLEHHNGGLVVIEW